MGWSLGCGFGFGLSAALALSGCSSASGDAAQTNDENDLTGAAAQLTFTKSSESLEGRLFEGETVKVTYAPERITSCTKGDGDPHHGPQFDYTLFYRWRSAPDDSFHSKLVANSNGLSTIELTAPFRATALEVYVELTNPRGCKEYDSAYGANFVYPVSEARVPTIHFDQDGKVSQTGRFVAGSDLLVDYASMRLESCNQSGRKLRMFGRIDGSDLPAQELAEESRYDRTIGRIHTQAGQKHLELWFETIDFHACTQWDSAGGANFQFDLE